MHPITTDVLAEQLALADALLSGRETMLTPQDLPGRWPKLLHRGTDVQVDILPEGERPGSPPELAPTTIPSPRQLDAVPGALAYVGLNTLVELKLAAARFKDKADIVEVLRANSSEIGHIRTHLAGVHSQYVDLFDSLMKEVCKDDTQR